jgi:hypothetical protein
MNTDVLGSPTYIYGNTIIVDNITNIDELDNVDIIVHGMYFWRISCKLLEYFGCIKTNNDKIFITIPIEIFTNDKSFIGFPICVMYFSHIKYCLNTIFSSGKRIEVKYSLLCDMYQYQQQYVEKILRTRLTYQMNEYQQIVFDNQRRVNTLVNLVCVGYFLATRKLPSQIEILLNNSVYTNYEKWTYKHIGTKIYDGKKLFRQVTQYSYHVLKRLNIDSYTFNEIISYVNIDKNVAYWIPFTPHKKWNEQPDSGINFSRLNMIEFRFPEACSGTLYFLTQNDFGICSGQCAKHFVS